MDQPKEEQHTEEPQAEDTQQSEQQPKEGGEQQTEKKGGWGISLPLLSCISSHTNETVFLRQRHVRPPKLWQRRW